MPSKDQIAAAKENLDRVATVYWGLHGLMPADHPSKDPAEIMERVMADYALVGRVPIDTLKERAKARVRSRDEGSG